MPQTQIEQQSHPIRRSIPEGSFARVRVDKSRLPANRRSLFGWFRGWYRNSLLRSLLSESSAVLHRSRWIREIRAVERSSGKDSIRHWRDQSLIPSAYADAYILHMQQTETLHPYLSIFDSLLLSRAWKAGLEYGIHIGKLQNREISCDQLSQVPDAGTDTKGPIAGVTRKDECTREKL
jgi:hypothetical protein